MASYEETQINILQKEIDDLNALIAAAARSGKQVAYKRTNYTIAEAAKLVGDLQGELANLVGQREAFLDTAEQRKRQQSVVQASLDTALDTLNWAIDAKNKGSIDEGLLQQYIDRTEALQRQLSSLTAISTGRQVAGATEVGGKKQVAPPKGTLTPELEAAYERRHQKTFNGTTAPTTTPSAVTKPTATVTKSQVTDALAAQGLADTPANRKKVREELAAGKTPAAPGYQAGWEDAVRREYSKYSWMLDDLDRTKYKDVFDLLAEAVNPQTKITDPELFKTRFEGTTWYRELATQQMGRKVRDQVGALSFDSGNYARLLNNAMRYGWEGANLKAEAYKEAFRRNDDGKFANPNAVGEARKSNDYLAIKTIGNAYLSPMSDDRIVDTLTGKTTQDDLLRIYREKAKVSNPHLAQAIDAGVTLEDIAYDYRKMAADVLGVPLAGIPLSEDFLGSALKGGDPAKPRLLTTNEWKTQLKSNPDYGYQFTANARKEVNDIVSSLEKAFGFVR